MHSDPRLAQGIIEGYRSLQCATLAELGRAINAARRAKARYCDAHQVQDSLFINGLDCSGKGCSVQIFRREPVSLSAAERELCSLLAVHLAGAYRLQRRWGEGKSGGASDAEAILTSTGRVEYFCVRDIGFVDVNEDPGFAPGSAAARATSPREATPCAQVP